MPEYNTSDDILPRALRSIANAFVVIGGISTIFLLDATDPVFSHEATFLFDAALSSSAGHIFIVSLLSALLWQAVARVAERRRWGQGARSPQRQIRRSGRAARG